MHIRFWWKKNVSRALLTTKDNLIFLFACESETIKNVFQGLSTIVIHSKSQSVWNIWFTKEMKINPLEFSLSSPAEIVSINHWANEWLIENIIDGDIIFHIILNSFMLSFSIPLGLPPLLSLKAFLFSFLGIYTKMLVFNLKLKWLEYFH